MGEGARNKGPEPRGWKGWWGERGQERRACPWPSDRGQDQLPEKAESSISYSDFPALKVMEQTLKGRSEGGFLSRQHLGRKHRGASRGGGGGVLMPTPPAAMSDRVLQPRVCSHPGLMVRPLPQAVIKARERDHFWWRDLTADIKSIEIVSSL